MLRRILRNGAVCFAAAMVVWLAGCAGTAGGASQEEGDLLASDEYTPELSLEVKNLNFYDAEIYAFEEGHRVRLGSVRGNATETFQFRWPPARNLQIEIHLISVGTYLSDRLPVDEGDELELIIEPDLHRQRPVRLRPRG